MTTAFDIAAKMVQAGISVFPTGYNKLPKADELPHELDEETGKGKATWNPYRERLASTDELNRWYLDRNGLAPGIARVHGKVSGNAETLDFDCDDAYVTEWEKIVEAQAPGLVSRLTRIRTPRPGTQFFYRCAEPVEGSQKLAQVPKTEVDPTAKPNERHTLIETRGEGGYACGPGTRAALHPQNRTYELVSGPPLWEPVTITAAERNLLLLAARTFNKIFQTVSETTEKSAANSAAGSIKPGDDFNARMTWSEILTARGYTKVFDRGSEDYWKRPGGSSQWSVTTNYRGSDLMFVFSTNCGLESEKAYSKFAAVAHWDHAGDYSAAAKALAAQGYGTNPERQMDLREYGIADGESAHQQKREPKVVLPEFKAITSKELFETKYELEYLIDGLLVARQPGGIFGGKKSLKTTIAIDLALSLSTGGRFLNHFQVNRAVRVGVMSGESGAATIKETAIRQAISKGRVLTDCTGVVWAFDLPTLGDDKHLEALERFVADYELEVLIIDPTYLCMPVGDAAGNLFVVGGLLKKLTALAQKLGITLLLCHHTRKNKIDPFAAPELEDIAWAGFQEWVRQWLLVGRREQYDPEHGGDHKLWLNVGGSAGHSGLWGVDVSEGTRQDPDGRRWDVIVRYASEVRVDAVQQQQEQKSQARDAKVEATRKLNCDRVVKFLKKRPNGDTRTAISEHTGLKGEKLAAAIEVLLDESIVEPCDVQKPNKNGFRTLAGFKLKSSTSSTPPTNLIPASTGLSRVISTQPGILPYKGDSVGGVELKPEVKG